MMVNGRRIEPQRVAKDAKELRWMQEKAARQLQLCRGLQMASTRIVDAV
jgi:hypothetical protein